MSCLRERNKTVPICRRHDCLHRKCQGIYQEPPTKFSKTAGYKVKIKKSIVFLYNSNEHTDTKIKIQWNSQLLIKGNKYLEVNLTKPVYHLYVKNYTMLLQEIKSNLNKWREIPCPWIGRFKRERYPFFPNWDTDLT